MKGSRPRRRETRVDVELSEPQEEQPTGPPVEAAVEQPVETPGEAPAESLPEGPAEAAEAAAEPPAEAAVEIGLEAPAEAAMEGVSRLGALEALLFVAEEPIPLVKLQEILGDAEPAETAASLAELTLSLESQGLGLMVQEVAGGFRLTTRPEANAWIQKLQQVKPVRLSRAALETLAIIAYRQPITKAEVEQIRGVAVDGVLRTLLERELVRILGRKAEAGRPILYGTGNQFLEHFGFKDLGDLPSLREIDELIGPSSETALAAPLQSTADLSSHPRGLFEVEPPDSEASAAVETPPAEASTEHDGDESEIPPTPAA